MSKGYQELAALGLAVKLAEMADKDGIVMLSNRGIANKLQIGQRQMNEMIAELVHSGRVYKTRGLLRINGSVKDVNGSVKEPNGSVKDARHEKTLKTLKTHEKHESPNGFVFKESSSSSNARANDYWLIPPGEMEEEEEYGDRLFRTALHDYYLMTGTQAPENLNEARRLFKLFIEQPSMLGHLDKMLNLWQARWSTRDGLKWKPQFKTILEHHLNGGKYRHPPT